jgi:hypothetical protein
MVAMARGRGLHHGLVIVAAIAGATYVSGELGEVAVLQTFGDAGEVYSSNRSHPIPVRLGPVSAPDSSSPVPSTGLPADEAR